MQKRVGNKEYLFNNFPYSNNYMDLLNMKNYNYNNSNGYLLSSGYYFYINYHLNNNNKQPPNYILFTNSKLYPYSYINYESNTKRYKTFPIETDNSCRNFKINIEYIKKASLDNNNSLYPLYYISKTNDKYASI